MIKKILFSTIIILALYSCNKSGNETFKRGTSDCINCVDVHGYKNVSNYIRNYPKGSQYRNPQ